MTYISWSSDFDSCCTQILLVLLAKLDSGEIHCPATALHLFACLPIPVGAYCGCFCMSSIGTVNVLNIRTPQKFVVLTVKFELCGSTIE